MTVVLFAVGIFTLAFVLHLMLWRVHRPKRALITLLLLFHAILIAGLLSAPHLPGIERFAPATGWEVFHVCLFHIAISLGYIVTYTALEADSPTLTIIAYVACAGAAGRSRDDLLTVTAAADTVGARFDTLCAGGMIAPRAGSDDVYILTSTGRRWAMLFELLRRLYRLRKGG